MPDIESKVRIANAVDVESPTVRTTSFTVPGSDGEWGSYRVRLPYKVSGGSTPTFTGTPAGSADTFKLVGTSPQESGEVRLFTSSSTLAFHADDEGSTVDVVYEGLGSVVRASHQNILYHVSNIPFFIPGTPNALASTGDYNLQIPILDGFSIADTGGVEASEKGSIDYAGRVAGLGDTTILNGMGFVVTGLTLSSPPIPTAYLSQATIIEISNEPFNQGGDSIEVSLSDSGFSGQNVGYIPLDKGSHPSLYVNVLQRGGHSNINGWVWLHRR